MRRAVDFQHARDLASLAADKASLIYGGEALLQISNTAKQLSEDNSTT